VNRETISTTQAYMLGITSITVTGHLLFIPVIVNQAGRDAWLSLLVAAVPALLTGWIVSSLSRLFPGQTLVDYCESIAGKWVGKALALTFLFFFFHHSALAIRGFGEFFTSAITPRTPIVVYFAAIVILAVYAVKSGLEVLARTNAIFLVIMIPIGLLASVLTHREKDYANFLPVLENGPGPMLEGALNLIALFSTFFVLSMVFPHVNETAKLRRGSVLTMLVLVVMFIGPVTGPVALFGGERAMGMSYPTFQMLRDIQVAELQRLDIIAILLWSLGSFAKVSLYLFAVSYGLSRVLEFEDYRFIVAPIGALLVIFSLLVSDNYVDVYRFLQYVHPVYTVFIELALPAALLAAAYAKLAYARKRGVRP